MKPTRFLPSVALFAFLAACSGTDASADKEPSDSAATTNAAVHIRREKDVALDPKMSPFHLVLDAAGPNVDSLTVKLQIHDPTRSSSTTARGPRMATSSANAMTRSAPASCPACGRTRNATSRPSSTAHSCHRLRRTAAAIGSDRIIA